MNKTALITGASSGIGKALAHLHAEQKGDLIIVARSESKLNELKKTLENTHGIKVTVMVKDLSQPGAAEAVYKEVKEQGLRVDFLINNAGFGGLGRFHERDWQKDLAMIQLNIVVLTALTRFFLPDFVKRKSGRILNVSSTASLMPGPLQAVYYATKAYVRSFSNAIAEELRGSHVSVTNLMPGATQTGFGRLSGMDQTVLFKKTASAQKVAQEAYHGMLKGKLDVVSGLTPFQRIMIFLLPLIPKKILLNQVHKMQEVD